MTNPHSFQVVLRTSTLLVLALSFNAFNVLASENGSYAGPDFLNHKDFAGPSRVAFAPRVAQDTSKVLGYTVQTAASLGTNNNSGAVQSIINPVDDTEPTPMPIVTTTTPTSTPPTSENEIDLSISSMQVRSRYNPYDATDKYEILVKVKNNGAREITQYDLFRSILRVTTGTNSAAIEACNVGSCQNVGNAYNASMYLSAPSVSSIPANSEQEYLFNSQTFLGSKPEFTAGVQYTIKAIVDDNAYFNEKVETNNTSYINFTAQSSTQCAQAGLRADIYGGPNQVCCPGLILEGGVCNYITSSFTNIAIKDASPRAVTVYWKTSRRCEISSVIYKKNNAPANAVVMVNGGNFLYEHLVYLAPLEPATTYQYKLLCDGVNYPDDGNEWLSFTTPSDNPPLSSEKVTICHKTGANTMVEIITDKDGWTNGHAKHDGDYLKNGVLPCRVPKTPTEPVATPPQTSTITDADKDALIKKLQERIARLEYKLSQIEQAVVEREKNRESNPDTTLTNRVAGKLLIQPQSVGEVWYVDPSTKLKYYLKDGTSAYQALKAFGLGISEQDFDKLDDGTFPKELRGKILLRVQSHGEAYYIDDAGVAHYLKDGAAAYELMRSKALGISNDDISKIKTGSLAE